MKLVNRFLNKIVYRLMCCGAAYDIRRTAIREINHAIQQNILASKLNAKAFEKYASVNRGRDMILFATGPSLNKFKPIEGCVKIGVNHAFLRIPDLDYFFAVDNKPLYPVADKLYVYNGNNCVKFLGRSYSYLGSREIIPEHMIEESDARPFVVDAINIYGHPKSYFPLDICTQPLFGGNSTVFPAMQFALYTRPRKIYIVGCDCSADGHFFTDNIHGGTFYAEAYVRLAESWKLLKAFASEVYPDTQIVSVNPVGLKGLFEDFYQE